MPRTTSPKLDAAALRRKAAGRRTISVPVRWDSEARSAPDGSLTLSGYAAVFDSESHDLGGFIETLAPGAFTRALASPGSDQFLLWSHDSSAILARRSAGTLSLHEDAKGLRVSARMVPTSLAKDVHLLVRSGHATGMSFAFVVGKDAWSEGRDGTPRRRVEQISQLFEVTITPEPAYPAASAQARSLRSLSHSQLVAKATSKLAAARGESTTTQDNSMLTDSRTAPGAAPSSPSITSKLRPVYGPGSPHSFFQDLAIACLAEDRAAAAKEAAFASGRGRVSPSQGDPGGPIPGVGVPTPKQARERLAKAQESDKTGRRDLSTVTNLGGGYLIGSNGVQLPAMLGEFWGRASRARGVLTSGEIFPVLPPQVGAEAAAVRLTQGTTAGFHSDNNSVSNQDLVLELAESPYAQVAGRVSTSQQLLDRSANPSIDAMIAQDLSAALAFNVDDQLLRGVGTSGETRGIHSWSPTSYTYTDASPTPAECLHQIGKVAAGISYLYGCTTDDLVCLMAPRRYAWLRSEGAADAAQVDHLPVGAIYQVPATRVNLGGSTSEDHVIVAARDAVGIVADPSPTIRASVGGSESGTLTVKFVAWRYAAAIVRNVQGVGVLSGSGLASPTFTP